LIANLSQRHAIQEKHSLPTQKLQTNTLSSPQSQLTTAGSIAGEIPLFLVRTYRGPR
jgi:hypothetical protein